MSTTFKWTNPSKTLKRLVNNEQVGMFVAETCARYMDKYIPMDTGMLAQNYITQPFRVTYTQPYAKRMFYGDGFNFSKDKHPLATSRWSDAMKSANKDTIAREISQYIKRGGI